MEAAMGYKVVKVDGKTLNLVSATRQMPYAAVTVYSQKRKAHPRKGFEALAVYAVLDAAKRFEEAGARQGIPLRVFACEYAPSTAPRPYWLWDDDARPAKWVKLCEEIKPTPPA